MNIKLSLSLSIAALLVAMVYQHLALRDAWSDIRGLSRELDQYHLAARRGH